MPKRRSRGHGFGRNGCELLLMGDDGKRRGGSKRVVLRSAQVAESTGLEFTPSSGPQTTGC